MSTSTPDLKQSINPELARAIEHFENQPGVGADQVEQLRSAIANDPQLLNDLNQEATAGQIRGFALQPASATAPNLVGTYDTPSGVITLPASSLQPTGTAASADLNAVLQVQEMSVRFANSRYPNPGNAVGTLGTTLPVTQEMVNNLQATLNGSPVLAQDIKRAATTPDPGDTFTPKRNHIENFGFVSGMSAGGTYDGQGKTLNLPPKSLQASDYNAIDMTFVLGHEIEHGFNHPRTRAAAEALRTEAAAVAALPGPAHDYTGPIGKYVQSGRDNEAEAEIAGWNSVLSRLQQTNPSANLAEMLNTNNPWMRDFVERDPVTGAVQALAVLPGEKRLSFNSDGSLSPTLPDNVTAMGRQFFDRPVATPGVTTPGRPLALGERGSSDYPNYYGAYGVEVAIEAERQHGLTHPSVNHRMTIDMTSLRLSENLLEREGIHIGTNPGTPQPYYDSSVSPAALHHFNHTQNGSVNPAHDHQHVPIVPAPASAPQPPASTLDGLSSNDRAMHARIREDIHAPVSDEAVTRAIEAAKLQGMQRPEQIGSVALVNDRLWLASNVPGFVASVDINQKEAQREPAPQAQNEQRERGAVQTPEPQETARSGPRM